MRVTRWLLLLLGWAWLGLGLGRAVADGQLAAERFVDPPADCRILKIIHGWPEDPTLQDRWMTDLRRQGFGGMVCNVAHPDYLRSPTAWRAFGRAVATARDKGFALWLYDELGYPSGLAGGQVLERDPDWEAEGLLAVEQACVEGSVLIAVPPGELVFARAYPSEGGVVRVDQAQDLVSRVAGESPLRGPRDTAHRTLTPPLSHRMGEGRG
jgi:hypothetical protein